MEIQFLEVLRPYAGKTYSGIRGGIEITYEERLLLGHKEINSLIKMGDRLKDIVIRDPDFEYDDCCRKYYDIVVLDVAKETGKITWWLRDD